jgi:hypothetical protein
VEKILGVRDVEKESDLIRMIFSGGDIERGEINVKDVELR